MYLNLVMVKLLHSEQKSVKLKFNYLSISFVLFIIFIEI